MTTAERIKAVYVLQRFVMMSRTLLPNLSELMSKKNPSPVERVRIDRIRDVYETFRANPEVSVLLVNSNIFQLIKDVYNTCMKGDGQTPQSFYTYSEFLRESDRLIEQWNRQQLN